METAQTERTVARLQTVDGIREFVKQRTAFVDFNQVINAWVFIWYPGDGSIGHAAMFIGPIAHESTYVSWWPQFEDNKILFRKYPARPSTGYELDCEREACEPDVIYGLKSLDEAAMLQAWREICHSKASPSFQILSKNCANIVGRVLKSGLINSPLRHRVFGILDGDFYVFTPKRIAVICNLLRDNNKAVKIRMSAKTRNLNPFKIAFRLR
ncbi:hypothetical protein [Rahnella woolbedingensis]|uniref:DUF4105 domain-containing protein n=1 Tax=Rahnella woolbedingensis TaxID=1510574 RepID=A0A419N2F8_9GAMM|nr:hypothetical protein [Rahnella woolbedingensis]RJT34367.1 hypothetical protein D6C13_23435 [Rahnella woolbedingensis]